jgi:hypothetical protein
MRPNILSRGLKAAQTHAQLRGFPFYLFIQAITMPDSLPHAIKKRHKFVRK